MKMHPEDERWRDPKSKIRPGWMFLIGALVVVSIGGYLVFTKLIIPAIGDYRNRVNEAKAVAQSLSGKEYQLEILQLQNSNSRDKFLYLIKKSSNEINYAYPLPRNHPHAEQFEDLRNQYVEAQSRGSIFRVEFKYDQELAAKVRKEDELNPLSYLAVFCIAWGQDQAQCH